MKNIAQLFKALGDETRLRIMALLLEGRELCVCDIMAVLKLPQSTVSRHLSYLRHSGLVDDRRQGVWMYYRLNDQGSEGTAELGRVLDTMLAQIEQVAEDRRYLTEHLMHKACDTCK